jgi:hypothetical protein
MRLSAESVIFIDNEYLMGEGVESPSLLLKVTDGVRLTIEEKYDSTLSVISEEQRYVNAESTLTINQSPDLNSPIGLSISTNTILHINSNVVDAYLPINPDRSVEADIGNVGLKVGIFTQRIFNGDAYIRLTPEEQQLLDISYSPTLLKILPPFIPFTLPSNATIHIDANEGTTYIESSSYLRIINLMPNYLANLDVCSSLTGDIPELTIPVKIGELTKIVTFEDEIDKIYNKPFSIYFNGNEIYGRLIKENPVTMKVYFKSGKVMKLTLVPYKSELIKFVLS